jgi:hypothetical protein
MALARPDRTVKNKTALPAQSLHPAGAGAPARYSPGRTRSNALPGSSGEYEPFTPVTQSVRGLLTRGHIGINAIVAIAWTAGLALASSLWAVRLYSRHRAAIPG